MRYSTRAAALAGVLVGASVLAGPAIAQSVVPTSASQTQQSETLEAVLERVSDRYAGERLLAARTIRVEEDIRLEFDSHDYNGDLHELTRQRRHYVLGFDQEAGSTEYLTEIANTFYHARSVLSDGNQRFIDYGSGTYEDQSARGFLAAFGGAIRGSDVLLARHLLAQADLATLNGQAIWLGMQHDLIDVPFPDSPDLTIWVERASGRITKMTRQPSPEMVVSYVFQHHGQDDGIAIAREYRVFVGSEPLQFSMNRRVAIDDPADASAFEVEASIPLEPERVDQSTMSVDTLAEGVFHVGEGEAYSTFFRSVEGLAVFGTDAGLAGRLTAYREATGDQSPLALAIVSDHHRSEIAGVAEALEAGAALAVTPDAAPRLREAFPDASMTEISDRSTIAGVSIVALQTAHASNVLVAYDPEAQVMVQSGHYISPYRDRAFYSKFTAVTLLDAWNASNIGDAKMIASTGSRKAEGWTDFAEVVATFDPTPCFGNRPICDGIEAPLS